jgi:hypothetical protein
LEFWICLVVRIWDFGFHRSCNKSQWCLKTGGISLGYS